MRAKYPGTCARTGQNYPAGTLITKGERGWEIAPGAHVAEWREIQTPEGKTVHKDVALPTYCRCVKERPGFDEKDPATYEAGTMRREGDTLVCPLCSRTLTLLPKPAPVKREPEMRTCWECGRKFTYAECKRNGGDWNENGGYCGC